MNLARISSNGQITVPVEIRRKLQVKEGDKIIFIENNKGEIIIKNSSKIAIQEAQMELKDVNITDREIQNTIEQIRYKKGEK